MQLRTLKNLNNKKMSSSVSSNKKYLSKKVNPIMELMIASLMKHRPTDPVEFMKNWLNEKGLPME